MGRLEGDRREIGGDQRAEHAELAGRTGRQWESRHTEAGRGRASEWWSPAIKYMVCGIKEEGRIGEVRYN